MSDVWDGGACGGACACLTCRHDFFLDMCMLHAALGIKIRIIMHVRISPVSGTGISQCMRVWARIVYENTCVQCNKATVAGKAYKILDVCMCSRTCSTRLRKCAHMLPWKQQVMTRLRASTCGGLCSRQLYNCVYACFLWSPYAFYVSVLQPCSYLCSRQITMYCWISRLTYAWKYLHILTRVWAEWLYLMNGTPNCLPRKRMS